MSIPRSKGSQQERCRQRQTGLLQAAGPPTTTTTTCCLTSLMTGLRGVRRVGPPAGWKPRRPQSGICRKCSLRRPDAPRPLSPSLSPGNEMTPMHACMRAARLPAWVIRKVVLEACAFITASPGVRRACGGAGARGTCAGAKPLMISSSAINCFMIPQILTPTKS